MSTSDPRTEPPVAEFIAAGTVSLVYALDDNHVIKRRPQDSDDLALQAFNIEIRVYERLGNHPRIAILREVTEKGLILERGECLRRKLQSLDQDKMALDTVLQWAREAADGLIYIHNKSVIHADVGCHNLLVDGSGHIKFIDFAGSGIDDEEALVCYEWWSYRPGSMPNVQTDIFAFGSMLFELESGKVPYHELLETLEMHKIMKRVETLYSEKKYPSVQGLVLGQVITRCWDGYYSSMDEVRKDLDLLNDGS